LIWACGAYHINRPQHQRRHIISLRLHRARNTLAKVSAADQDAVKADYWQIFDDIHAEPGEPAVAEARRRAEAFAARWGARYPGAVACVLDTLPELTTHLRFPREHWGRIRHSNLIERTFGETRRRTKVIGRLPDERSCLSLVWAVLDRASRGCVGWTSGPPTCDCCSSCAASYSTRPHPSVREVMRRLTRHPRRITSVMRAYAHPFPPPLGRHRPRSRCTSSATTRCS
jgi:transposase-like protein